MVRIFTISAVLAASITAGGAQSAPSERLAATGSREAIEKFVAVFATPTRMTGKIARWEDGICPLTVGQQPAVTKFVTQRVKDVAAMVGAPVNAAPSCTPNIEIVFTKIPQELLDNVRKNQPEYLGYAESNAEREKLATVSLPVQSWYSTQTRDRKGMNRIDSGRRLGQGVALPNFTGLNRGASPEYLPDATYASVTGDHISDGVRSAFYHIIIVADINRLGGYEAGPLADYIAVLALTQLNSLDACQQLPSIVNMLAKGCEAKTGKLTGNDIAYLHGLYRMSSDRQSLSSQKGEIGDVMQESLGGQ